MEPSLDKLWIVLIRIEFQEARRITIQNCHFWKNGKFTISQWSEDTSYKYYVSLPIFPVKSSSFSLLYLFSPKNTFCFCSNVRDVCCSSSRWEDCCHRVAQNRHAGRATGLRGQAAPPRRSRALGGRCSTLAR